MIGRLLDEEELLELAVLAAKWRSWHPFSRWYMPLDNLRNLRRWVADYKKQRKAYQKYVSAKPV